MKLDRMHRNALFIILEGIAAATVLNLYNPFLQMLAKRLGGGDIHVALVNSLPPLVAIFVLIPCSIALERFRNKKTAAVGLLLINSVFFLAIAFVPFLPDEIKVIIYLIFVGLMNWPASLYTTAWQSFFSDNFRGSIAGRVYSVRSSLSTFFGLLTVLVTGYLLSSLPGSDLERIRVYQVFYAACFAVTLFQAFSFWKIRPLQPKRKEAENGKRPFSKADFKAMLENRPYILYCLLAFAFHVTWQMGWPLFFIYNVDYARLNEFQLGLINVAAGIVSFASYPLWNRFIEKKGAAFALIFATLGLATNPVFYIGGILSLHALLAINAYVGLFSAGFTLTLFLGLLKTLPADRKIIYISVFNTFISVSGFASPLAGVWLYGKVGIHTAFVIIVALRAAASALYAVKWLKEKKKARESADNTMNF